MKNKMNMMYSKNKCIVEFEIWNFIQYRSIYKNFEIENLQSLKLALNKFWELWPSQYKA